MKSLSLVVVGTILATSACVPASDTTDERSAPEASATPEAPLIAGEVDEFLAGVTTFSFEPTSLERRYEKLLGPGLDYYSADIFYVSTGRPTGAKATFFIWPLDESPSSEEHADIVGRLTQGSPEEASLGDSTIYRVEAKGLEYVAVFPAVNALVLFEAPPLIENQDPRNLDLDRLVLAVIEELTRGSSGAVAAEESLVKAARATLSASTGRYINTTWLRARGSPDGAILKTYGKYDGSARLVELRYVLGRLVRGNLPWGSEMVPHVLMVFKGGKGYVSRPTDPVDKWVELDMADAVDQLDLGLPTDVSDLSVPALLDILRRKNLVRSVVENDQGRITTYRGALLGKTALDFLSLGTVARLVKRLGLAELRELFSIELPLDVTVSGQGFIRRGLVDMSPLMRAIVAKTAPKSERSSLDWIYFRSKWWFDKIGKEVEIPYPPPGAPKSAVV